MFFDYDIHRREGLSFSQFASLIESEEFKQELSGVTDVRRLLTSSGGNGSDLKFEDQLQSLFDDGLEYLEQNDTLREEKLLGLESLKEIILERNLESLPFYSYVKVKYNSAY